ncbi:hypothetical protein [Ferribacterium limneticum]|uniref:hypothetical protein n=1 Tax=Ferribacterium limneticum TaxID=76259 RepID=UPI001CFA11F2|nr:hypothetical protein [Ferribacterium limneticum]UCV28079.1 hypothetical protein KI617_17840 [Ferribacterium limneticum]UCV31996.1 hypothetical protein KI608_17840 [Ferribacterium limneticum]
MTETTNDKDIAAPELPTQDEMDAVEETLRETNDLIEQLEDLCRTYKAAGGEGHD